MPLINWSDYYSLERLFHDSAAALGIMSLLGTPTSEDCARNVQEQSSLAALAVGNVSRDLLLARCITRTGKSLKKSSKKKEKLTTLSSAGRQHP